jgi:hypothetical protein
MPAALDERASLWSMVLCENVCLFDHKLLWVVRESSKTSRYVRISRLDFSMMTGRMRWRFKNGEMLIKWKRSIWLDFFFFFPSSPLDSLDRFSDCRQGQFPRSDFSLFRSVRSVCVCVCVYTLINLPDERVVNVVQSTKHRSRTSNSFQYWINGYILPTVCHQATTKRTKEKKKRPSSSARRSSLTVWKKEKQKSKKNHDPGACLAVRGRVNIDSHTITRERATPRLWTSNRISYWLGDRLFLL